MQQAKVQVGDRVLTLEVPDGTTEQEIISYVQGMQKPDFDWQGALYNFAGGSSFGFVDELAGVFSEMTGGDYESARDDFRARAAEFQQDNPKTAFGLNVAGGLAWGAPGAKSLAARTAPGLARGAALGASGGALAGLGYSEADNAGDMAVDTAAGAVGGAALGGAVGALAPVVAAKAGRVMRKFLGRPQLQVFDEAGQFTDDAIARLNEMVSEGKISGDDAQEAVRRYMVTEGVLTPEQAQRWNLFARRGVRPVRPDITQSTDDFLQKQSALKRSGPVADVVAGQDARLTELVQEGIEKAAPMADDVVGVNARAWQVTDRVVSQMDDEVNRAYAAARQVAQGQPRVRLNRMAEAISNSRGNERASGGVVSYARNLLRNKGLIRAGRDIDINKRGPRAKGGDLRALTVKEAEEIRQGLNEIYDSVTPAGRRMIRALKDALDDDVAAAAGDDIFEGARAAKTAFHRTIERARRNKFDAKSGSFLEDVIDNKIPEEKIFPKLMASRDDEFAKYLQFLREAGDDGVQVIGDIKAQVLRDALEAAQKGKLEGGGAGFNARIFASKLRPLRKTEKFKALFDADDRQLIDDIIEIGRLRVPPNLVQQGRGPTEMAVERLRRRIMPDFAQDLMDEVANVKADNRLLNPTRETARQLGR